MKFIDTKTHGYLDYIVALLLIASPWIFNFAYGGLETWVPVILGIATIGYSVVTDYEMGAMRRISMRSHLMMDLVSAVLLALSPWIFGFADRVWQPHLIFGLLELGVVLFSKRVPTVEVGHGHSSTVAH